MIKKIVITGGAGYIGSTLINQLPKETEIVVIDNFHIDTEFKRKNSESIKTDRNVTVINANVSEVELYSNALENTDVIIYMASLNSYKESNAEPLLYLQENGMNLQVFLNAVHRYAPGVKKCILTSSRGVYGEGPYTCKNCGKRMYPTLSENVSCTYCRSKNIEAQAITEEDKPNPSSYYGLSKKLQEDILHLFCTQHSIELDILRIFNVYGENQGNYYSNIGIIPQIYSQITQHKEMYLQGDGKLARDFVYVGDVVEVLLQSIFSSTKRKNNTEIFNVGSGQATTIQDIADFFDKLGYSFVRHNKPVYNDIKYSVADNSKVTRHYSIQSIKMLDEFLSDTYKSPKK